MEIATIQVQQRAETGTKKVRRLREENKIPAVLYGGGKESVSISVNHEELSTHLRHHLRVYQLQLGGQTQGCYLKAVQWDTLTDEPLHVDFERIDLHKEIEIEVEVNFVGHPKGLTHGGDFVKDLMHVTILCLPAQIPEELVLKVDHLDLHDHIYARELELPEGCKLAVPEDAVVCHVTGEKVEEPEPVLGEGEGEIPEGGAEGEKPEDKPSED